MKFDRCRKHTVVQADRLRIIMEKQDAAARKRALDARLEGKNTAKYPKEENDDAAVAAAGAGGADDA